MKIGFLAFVFLLTLNVSALEIIENIPAGTKILAKLDLAKLKASPFYAKFREKKKAETDFFLALFSMMSGISVDEVNNIWLIAIENQNGILVMEGNFDIERIKQLFNANNSEIVKKDKVIFALMMPNLKNTDQKNLAVIIDKKTIAVGQPDRVDDFLAVKDGKHSALSSQKILSLKKDFSDNYLFKMILLELPQKAVENQVFKNIESCDLSLDLNENLDLKLRFFMIDEEITKATESIVSGGMVYLRRMNFPEKQIDNEYAKILKEELALTLNTRSEKTLLEINAKITGQALNRLIELQPKMDMEIDEIPPCQIESEEDKTQQ